MPFRALFVLAALLTPGALAAATFTLTRFDDPLPGNCLPTDCSLREAVLAANAAPGADRIVLGVGDYVLTRVDEPPPEAPGTSQQLVVTDDLSIEGVSHMHTRILPAALINAAFQLDDSVDAELRLTDLAIEGMQGASGAIPLAAFYGGAFVLTRIALRDNSGSLPAIYAGVPVTVVDSVFENNASAFVIGAFLGPAHITGSIFRNNSGTAVRVGTDGVAMNPPLGGVVLRDNVFEGNVVDGPGAAVQILVTRGNNRVDLSGSTFDGNTAAEAGGAVSIAYSSTAPSTTRLDVVAHRTVFRSNASQAGCGALALGAPPVPLLVAPTVDIADSRFEDNNAVDDGGALCSSVDTRIVRSTFDTNGSDGDGGAIVQRAGTLEITHSTLTNNSATNGGGIASQVPVDLFRSTLDRNSATATGGALHLQGTGDSVLRFVTLHANRAATLLNGLRIVYGAGQARVRFDNSILQACSSTSALALLDSQQNLESPGSTCGLGSLNNKRNVSATDLALGPLADNGGPTLTRLPQPGSAALDYVMVVPSCTVRDQRGYRGVGGFCDIGAVEAGALPVPPEVFANGFE